MYLLLDAKDLERAHRIAVYMRAALLLFLPGTRTLVLQKNSARVHGISASLVQIIYKPLSLRCAC